MEIRILADPMQLELAYERLKDLRQFESFPNFLALYHEARRADGYELVGLMDGEDCIAVMGYRVLFDFIHGKHLYVDDLVVAPEQRSRGLGARLLDYAEGEAWRRGCALLRLSTGTTNAGGQKFYAREGWQLRSVVYKKNTPRR